VVVEQIAPCWSCHLCRRGRYNLCIPHSVFGFRQDVQGAMAEFVKVPARGLVYKISSKIPSHHAAFAEPLACSLHAVELGNIKSYEVVVVSGCGPLGLGCIAGAKRKNARLVMALDLLPDKLELARASGADVVVNPAQEDAQARVLELTGGLGCDVYIEVAGNPASVTQGLKMCGRGAKFVEFSVFGRETTCDWTTISDAKELTVQGGHLSLHTFPAAVRLIEEGALPLDKIVTHVLPLERFKEGIDLVNDSKNSIKVCLLPHAHAD